MLHYSKSSSDISGVHLSFRDLYERFPNKRSRKKTYMHINISISLIIENFCVCSIDPSIKYNAKLFYIKDKNIY